MSARNDDGETPLIRFASHMSGPCVNAYHIHGKGVNHRLEAFIHILRYSPDVNAKNTKGQSALHALSHGYLRGPMTDGRFKAAKLLIAKGAEITFLDADGRTARTLFIQNDTDLLFQTDSELVRLLGNPIIMKRSAVIRLPPIRCMQKCNSPSIYSMQLRIR